MGQRSHLNPSRRQFLTALGAAGGALLSGADRLRSAEVDPRVAQILSTAITVDMHNHVQVAYLIQRIRRTPSRTTMWRAK